MSHYLRLRVSFRTTRYTQRMLPVGSHADGSRLIPLDTYNEFYRGEFEQTPLQSLPKSDKEPALG